MSTTDQVKSLDPQTLVSLTGNRLGPYCSFNAVNRAQIWQWCSAMGDNNPLYLNDNYRKQTEFDGPVAPPAMMQMWTMRDFNDQYAPGSTEAKPYQVFDTMAELGYAGNVAVSYDITFHRYLLEGDRAHHYTTVVNISDAKTTALGLGYFVTERVEFRDQNDTLFAEALISYFQYRPADIEADSAQDQDKTPTIQIQANPSTWQPDFSDIDIQALSIGDTLPELVIPVTHRLIVGGAIATQDFIPVHHNVPAAQAAAMPDIFMNILTTSGLCARYLSDWAGPSSRLQKLQFKLMAPNLPGDSMTLSGQISDITPQRNLSVNFSGSNALGLHVAGTAKLAL